MPLLKLNLQVPSSRTTARQFETDEDVLTSTGRHDQSHRASVDYRLEEVLAVRNIYSKRSGVCAVQKLLGIEISATCLS
jgi:hypothetical protein